MNSEVNHCIARFGESVRQFFRAQKRSEMTSQLFNLPGRLLLGSHCYYENLPKLLDEILRHAGEAAIGRGMKRLCNRPNYVHLNSLALGYLIGREQLRLCGTDIESADRDTASVMKFWSNVARNYRNDGRMLPEEAGFTVPILPAQTVRDLNSHLRRDMPETRRRQIHRMVATTELFTFILHGEARVGVFHHGPYPLDDPAGSGADTIVIKELVGLRYSHYPWAQLKSPMQYDNIACVMRLRNVRSKIVLFGTLTTEPRDYAQSIAAEGLFVVENGDWRALPDDEIPAVTQTAADAQLELYRRVIDWDERYRIAYGAELYGYLLKSFADQLGFGVDFGRRIRTCFAATVDRHLESLHSGSEQPAVLRHIATTNGPVFSPLSTAKASRA